MKQCCPNTLATADNRASLLISFKIAVLFVLICIEKYHSFERNENRATVFLAEAGEYPQLQTQLNFFDPFQTYTAI